jgi:hypothetical protein
MSDYIIGIDPGNKESAFCLVSALNLQPIFFQKEANAEMWRDVFDAAQTVGWDKVDFAVEMIASYGMPVGREVFDTVLWIGQMKDRIEGAGKICNFIYRKDEKMAICHSMKANDASIRQALVDRFAYGVPNFGKGTKKAPGWFYGFRADIWQSYAIAVTYYEKTRG